MMGQTVAMGQQQVSALQLLPQDLLELLQAVQTRLKYSLSQYLKAQPVQPDRREVMVAMVAMAQQRALELRQPRQALLA